MPPLALWDYRNSLRNSFSDSNALSSPSQSILPPASFSVFCSRNYRKKKQTPTGGPYYLLLQSVLLCWFSIPCTTYETTWANQLVLTNLFLTLLWWPPILFLSSHMPFSQAVVSAWNVLCPFKSCQALLIPFPPKGFPQPHLNLPNDFQSTSCMLSLPVERNRLPQ